VGYVPDQPRDQQFATTSDGRTVCFAEWGDPAGFPVVLLHGTPGGRYSRPPDESVITESGVRLITLDRPGYGGSDRLPGRAVVSGVEDVAAIVDQLGIERFAVTGSSGGGPHVLAVAARLGDRVVRARCNVGVAPYDAEGLDFFAGMDPNNVEEFGWALEGEERLVQETQRLLQEMGDRMAVDATKFLPDDWELDDSDRAVMARPEIAAQNKKISEELVAHGLWGWVDDDIAFTKPWGFELEEIAVPVRVCYGIKDVLVPAAHGEWLARHVPGAEAEVHGDSGHLTDPSKIREILAWLAGVS
jgi:pimeloyl-ACP methyl ester carboxylesterase